MIALSEAPLKNADIPSVLDMASALHTRYPDFATSLGPTLAKVVVGAAAASKPTPGVCVGGGGGCTLFLGLISSRLSLLGRCARVKGGDWFGMLRQRGF